MSDVAPVRGGEAGGAFRARTVAAMVIVGVVGFVGMLVLGAYAPDFRSGHNGGAHALSNAAVGYSGLIRLAEATGRNPVVIRNDHQLGGEDLLVATPEHGFVDVSTVLAARAARPTLFVLPKWATVADREHSGWVRRAGLLLGVDPEGVLAPSMRFHIARRRSGGRPLVTSGDLPAAIRFTAPRPLQVIAATDRQSIMVDGVRRTTGMLRPLVTDGHGGIVVGQIDGRPLYVLADPDLLSNFGMRDARQAASALALLDWMNSNRAGGIAFDVTLNGFGHSRSPLKLAFDPPFLAMTLAIAAALLLAGLHALGSFGAPRRRERALAFGKCALVDNTAALVRKAGRQARLGGRYAAVVRERAGRAFGVPARLKGDAADAYLDRLPGRQRFTTLAAAAEQARDPSQLLAAAQALHQWQETTR